MESVRLLEIVGVPVGSYDRPSFSSVLWRVSLELGVSFVGESESDSEKVGGAVSEALILPSTCDTLSFCERESLIVIEGV